MLQNAEAGPGESVIGQNMSWTCYSDSDELPLSKF